MDNDAFFSSDRTALTSAQFRTVPLYSSYSLFSHQVMHFVVTVTDKPTDAPDFKDTGTFLMIGNPTFVPAHNCNRYFP